MAKYDVLNGALALNGDDKRYKITVENDCIITEVKWMDATFFSPTAVTDEMRNFRFTVKLHNGKKWTEIDEINESKTAVSGKGLDKKVTYFKGNTISFSKTVGVGKNNIDGNVGVIDAEFYSEAYKMPVRNYLKSCGYKKKMNGLAKAMLISFVALLVLAAVLIPVVLISGISEKETISPDEFYELMSESEMTIEDLSDHEMFGENEVETLLVGECEYMYVQYWVLFDEDLAQSMYEGNCSAYIDEYSANTIGGSGINYDRTELSGSDDEFMIIARIEDTVLIGETTAEYKDELKQIFETLGY